MSEQENKLVWSVKGWQVLFRLNCNEMFERHPGEGAKSGYLFIYLLVYLFIAFKEKLLLILKLTY